MAHIFFISDIHFGLESRERERAKEDRVMAFLDHVIRQASHLYIVGDLFDTWFEYKTVIPKGFHRILTGLEDITRRGIPIDYLVGNHDFWVREYFTDTLGIAVHQDPIETSIDGKRILIHHGDGLAQNDAGYRILKRVLRNKFNIALYTWLHPDIGLRLAQHSSRASRGYTSGKDYGESDGMLVYATRKIQEGCDIVVMGHRHMPVTKAIGTGTYINLGDWIRWNSYAEMDNGVIELKMWG